MGIDIRKASIAVAKAGAKKLELGTAGVHCWKELCTTPGEFSFVWTWAQQMLGLPPFPVWTEFANEVQQIGGGSDGIEEFMMPMLRYGSEQELNMFYIGIQGWSELPAFFRLPFQQTKLVVFLREDCPTLLGMN